MAFWIGRNGRLRIGDGCAISNTTIISQQTVEIHDNTFIGGGCEIYDTDFHQLDPVARRENVGPITTGSIVIGPDAFIGSGTIILKDVTIGKASIVGAGSVVTKSIPANQVWGGVPARFIRDLPSSENSPQISNDAQ
ncbi:acyltransferase [Roseiconus lacunae]|uniref:acyltransferase n=1 Tax=Roseiconus lacunae TaxID=2605694 RepID=UPI0011F30190|nr:acyltransferase [Roseiconus lacunae]WRQ49873.1 acyltransferase [Stieleria sp. HD01]